MNILLDKYQQRESGRLLFSETGFSLVELLVGLVIVVVVLAGVGSSFNTFNRHGSQQILENEQTATIKATLQLLKRDLNMAGFGLCKENRLAEDNQYETAVENEFTADYFNGDGDADDNITEANVNYDLNNDGDTSDLMYRDRLYIANGWTILEDITTDGSYDGDIVQTPIDYFHKVASRTEDGGYFAELTSPASVGATSISVDNININSGDEFLSGNDFKSDGSTILYGHDASGSYSLEGLPNGAVSSTQIQFLSGESLSHAFVMGTPPEQTQVVPAISWYVEQKTGATPPDKVKWLYRDQDKVLRNVIGFQVSFGYDQDNDGLQWSQTIPPGFSIDGETDITAQLRSLRAARVVLTVIKDSVNSVPIMKTYEKVVILKN